MAKKSGVVEDRNGLLKRLQSSPEALARFFGRREANLGLLFDSVGDAIILTDTGFRITGWNKAAETIYGWKAEQAIGQDVADLLKARYPSGASSDEMRKKLLAESAGSSEVIHTGKDGQERYLLSTANVQQDSKGNAIGVVFVVHDITERKKTEAELAHLASFPELNPNPVIELDSSGQITYLNPASKALFPDLPALGIKHSYLAGWETLVNKLQSERPGSATREVDTGDSWYEETAIYVPGTNIYRLYGRDITQRKKTLERLRESEERFFRAFHASPVAQTISRLPDGRRIEVNDSFLHMFEYTREEVIGHTSDELNMFDPNERARIVRIFLEKGSVQNLELAARTKSGKPLTVLSCIEKISVDGQDHSIAILLDITERKKAEQLKDEFIGLVSHEIRTPVTIIIGAIGVAMSEGITPEDSRGLLRDALDGAESLNTIVENLIELSRYQSNRLTLEKEMVDVAWLAQNIAEKEKSTAGNHRILVDILPGVPTVQADKVRVSLILRNLLSNAVKYSAEGTEIRVSIGRDKGHLVISVADQGVGIPPEQQTNLFQPFERLENPARPAAGLGLGLLVCKRLVEAHGGKIWVTSEPGHGSTFNVMLPLPPG